MGVVELKRENDLVWITVNNPPVNATSHAVRQELWDAVHAIGDSRLAVLAGAGTTFIAGGDMTEFDGPPVPPHLPDVVQAIESSSVPILALLHGHVLGGGLEIAMGCAFRIAAPGTKFGLPEVNVGLIPGAGGTQRAPRLLGWERASDLACDGRLFTAEDMLAIGGIDAIEPDLRAAALAHHAPRPVAVSQRAAPALDTAWLEERRRALTRKAKGQQAPLHNLNALTWAQEPFDQGQPKERELHLSLRLSQESQALRHVFFAERAVAKPAAIARTAAQDLHKISVVGGGLMGSGIAASALTAGYEVTIIERDEAAAQTAHGRVLDMLKGAVARGKMSQEFFDTQQKKFQAASDYKAAEPSDLAIEAVFEDLGAKQEVFRNLAQVVSKNTILATNTSYLDPRVIFEEVPDHHRCVGLHFFAPAHIMKLLEVVHLPQSSTQTLATSFAFAKRLRKTAVLSGICDGFIGNRILAAYRRAAEYMLADGALPSQIDAAMHAFGLAMGPFQVQDLSGLQIGEANRRRHDATRPASERYIDIADQICAMGHYGQRSGKGWYRYEEGTRSPQPDPEIEQLVMDYSAKHGISRRSYTKTDIQDQLLAIMANEGARIVEEGIAEHDGAVDCVKIHGYGFPRWRGGPMLQAKIRGVAHIREQLSILEGQSPSSWVRAQIYR